MLGIGGNYQRHCAWDIYAGIGFKFRDFIQAIHRVQRVQQRKPVRIDLIYAEAERQVRQKLERKWDEYKKLTARMVEIIREYGLAANALHLELRHMFTPEERQERNSRQVIPRAAEIREVVGA